jgi:serine/threonine protein kinase
MAPEQARGDNRFVGPAADIWALGVILYECLTGKRPFDADDTMAVLRKVPQVKAISRKRLQPNSDMTCPTAPGECLRLLVTHFTAGGDAVF